MDGISAQWYVGTSPLTIQNDRFSDFIVDWMCDLDESEVKVYWLFKYLFI